jgi:hypothetical protein
MWQSFFRDRGREKRGDKVKDGKSLKIEIPNAPQFYINYYNMRTLNQCFGASSLLYWTHGFFVFNFVILDTIIEPQWIYVLIVNRRLVWSNVVIPFSQVCVKEVKALLT